MRIKKMAVQTDHSGRTTKRICLQYDQQQKMVTIGGEKAVKSFLWELYIGAFKECDGEPNFYTITNGYTRLSFTTTFKNFNIAVATLENMKFQITEVSTFNRLM